MKKLLQHVREILIHPKDAWEAIAADHDSVAVTFLDYVAPLALIPAVAGFIGMSLIGFGGFGVTVRVPLLWGLVNLVVGYSLSILMVYVMALVVEALAPAFGGIKNRTNAVKLVAYSSTASFAGGVFSLIPSLSILGSLVALYSVYLVYVGLPVMMQSKAAKSMEYTVVILLCAIFTGVLLGTVAGLLTSTSPH